MARQRVPYHELTPAYRGRLERAGITPEMHAAGASLKTARGHGHDDLWREFKKKDGHHMVQGFDRIPLKDKKRIAEAWINGYMTPGPTTGKRKATKKEIREWEAGLVQRRVDHEDFLRLVKEYNAEPTEHDWENYRQDYTQIFGAG